MTTSYYTDIKKMQFDCCHKIKRMLCPRDTTHSSVPVPSTKSKGLKVPKLEAPTFDTELDSLLGTICHLNR